MVANQIRYLGSRDAVNNEFKQNYKFCYTNVKELYLKTKLARVKFKRIGGGRHRRWIVWLNLILRKKSYRILNRTVIIYIDY